MEYDDEMLDQINNAVNLIEYVGNELELERKGNEYFAHCPKHTDKTASLSFTPETNKFFCFSCGRGGGIIQYLQKYEGMKLDDAIKKASVLANMDLSNMCKSKTLIFLKKLKKTSSQGVENEFNHNILDYSEYERYVKRPITEWIDEGIDQSVMDLFDIRIDTYGNRIVYPVYDNDGRLINIKGRTMYSDYKNMGIPKYLNYKKVGKVDYFQGLHITKPYILEKNEIIIFESIKSVMKAYGWGYKNCVSAEKHGLTKEQIGILLKLRVNVVFAYDSDISYYGKDVKKDIDILKPLTNVYIIEDVDGILGGKESKNAPVDLGKDIWEELYNNKKRML